MANILTAGLRDFWHTLTSNDRHASANPPNRTGDHVAISQSRHAPLTSVSTSAIDSHQDLSSTYYDEGRKQSISSNPGQSPSRQPYSPGMRTLSSPKVSTTITTAPAGEIPMQNFADGAPPPPPVGHSWSKIERWAERHYPELYDQLGEGCTLNDINELEHELDMSLPQDVRDSLAKHDGQERGGRPTGIIFGCMLLDCEEIVQEWKNWKIVNEEYLSAARKPQPHLPSKSSAASSSSSQPPAQNGSRFWRQELLDKQESQPPNAVQKAYAHPAWICLARDWGGNNIAVDLAPGPTGTYGQIIIFGRDYDCKYVVARSWAHFLAIVADDLGSEKVFVDDETGELKLKEFRSETVEPPYLEILRWRVDQKFGRKGNKRKPQAPPGLNTTVNGQNGRSSPYASPVATSDDRGRSPQRFARGPNGSPRMGVGSPLARVQEEIAAPLPIRAKGDIGRVVAASGETDTSEQPLIQADKPANGIPSIDTKGLKNKLIDVPTPVSATAERKDFPVTRLSRVSTEDDDKENQVQQTTSKEQKVIPEKPKKPTTLIRQQSNVPATKGLGVEGMDEMSNVAI